MRNAVLMGAAGLLLTMFAGAQQPTMQTVEGCVSKQAKGHWVITGGKNGLQQYRVTGGDEAALAKLDGHTVRVTGPVGESDPQVQATTPPNPGSTTGVTYNTIVANQVQDVTGNCSEHGYSRTASSN